MRWTWIVAILILLNAEQAFAADRYQVIPSGTRVGIANVELHYAVVVDTQEHRLFACDANLNPNGTFYGFGCTADRISIGSVPKGSAVLDIMEYPHPTRAVLWFIDQQSGTVGFCGTLDDQPPQLSWVCKSVGLPSQ